MKYKKHIWIRQVKLEHENVTTLCGTDTPIDGVVSGFCDTCLKKEKTILYSTNVDMYIHQWVWA